MGGNKQNLPSADASTSAKLPMSTNVPMSQATAVNELLKKIPGREYFEGIRSCFWIMQLLNQYRQEMTPR